MITLPHDTQNANLLAHDTRAINSVNYVTQYAYDNRDQITTLTYPDGRVIAYSRDTLGRITQATSTVNGVARTITNGMTYRADGLLTNQTFGNGLTETRTYDLQGRLTQSTQGAHTVTYQYDANSNVTQKASAGGNQGYAYDARDRLTGDTSTLGLYAFTYDPNANRLTRVKDGNTRNYVYTANTNRLIGHNNKTYTLDAAGHTTSLNNGQWTFGYNNQGRLYKVYKDGILKGTYTYNAQGQRVRKDRVKNDGSTVTRIYHYDLTGHLLAETTLNGKPRKDYVWINTTPVAQIKTRKPASGLTDKAIYYLHTDHLNTPRSATDATKAVVWTWYSDAFGKQRPNPDPDLDTTKVRINLRFPGQYYDKESKLFYNWNRYYSPKLGRYITSDPIGLEGGLNTYGYVGGNPLSSFDSDGLEVKIIGHLAAGAAGRITNPNSFHLAIWINPKDKSCGCGKGKKLPKTIGAQYENGKLVTKFNYPGDQLSNATFKQTITPPSGKSECEFIRDMVKAAAKFRPVKYAFPSIFPFPFVGDGHLAKGEYNSNSHVAGVLQECWEKAPCY